MQDPQLGRRGFLSAGAFGLGAVALPSSIDVRARYEVAGRFAEELSATPGLGEGPFYPDRMPLDTDNDLLLLNDSITPAVGEITHLSGRVLSKSGEPIRNAFVEIWQVDHKGSYLHSEGAGPDGSDEHFQGYGRFLTDVRGQYYFRTIKPVPYGEGRAARVPHIHIAVNHNGKRLLTTQMLVAGHQGNDEDGVLRGLAKEKRPLVMAEFRPLEGSKLGELTVDFDLVLGRTPEDHEEEIRGGISKAQGGRRRRGR